MESQQELPDDSTALVWASIDTGTEPMHAWPLSHSFDRRRLSESSGVDPTASIVI